MSPASADQTRTTGNDALPVMSRQDGLRLVAGLLTAVMMGGSVLAQGLRTDSRTPFVHRLTLYDHEGEVVDHTDTLEARPYSPTITCGKCHDIDRINSGWHFNAVAGGGDPGRSGEPWVLVDLPTRTQVPLSLRRWIGAWQPQQLGLSLFEFTHRFGPHLPGNPGASSDPGPDPGDAEGGGREAGRWHITGVLENDCMICHSADASYDAGEWARQVEKQNFRWAPVAALGLARIQGDTRKLPEDFDPEFPELSTDPDAVLPGVKYDQSRFGAGGRVFFDIVRQPNNERCYFCHTSHRVGPESAARWQHDMDVHMRAGMNCSDCHRHGLDHHVVRGYEGEAAHSPNPAADTLSCRACHIAEPGVADRLPDTGRLGAPIAMHKGLPPLHFDLLSCTACHSGPWPGSQAAAVQTSLAHGLGLADEHRASTDPPSIAQPVFVRGADGRLEPRRMLWPAYWGRMEDQQITAVPITEVNPVAVEPSQDEPQAAKADHRFWEPIRTEQIHSGLVDLQKTLSNDQQAVYITGGKAHRLSVDGQVEVFDHQAARPYSWALGHDVRGAGQSLGVDGCRSCHAADSPMVMGAVIADPASPLLVETGSMHEFGQVDPVLWQLWARAFATRTLFKIVAVIAAAVITAALLLWAGRVAFGRRDGQARA